MAADGLEQKESLAAGDEGTAPTEKIAICGTDFLCGMAGTNPIYLSFPDQGVEIRYNFQNWISSVKTCRPCSTSEFSSIVQKQARNAFRDVDKAFKIEQLWNSQFGKGHILAAYEIAGYNGELPEVCMVSIEIDRNARALVYPDPQCSTGAPVNPSPTSCRYFPLVGTYHANIDTALVDEASPQKAAFVELQLKTIGSVRALLPNAPPPFYDVVAGAISYIRVECSFNPQKVGGKTLVGVIIKGHLPALLHPDE